MKKNLILLQIITFIISISLIFFYEFFTDILPLNSNKAYLHILLTLIISIIAVIFFSILYKIFFSLKKDIKIKNEILQNNEKNQKLAISILEILNRYDNKIDIIHNILILIKQFSGIDSIGIRLKEENDYPYFETEGFNNDFLENERLVYNHTTLNHTCLCGVIISNQKIKLLKPFITAKGSFWSNNLTDVNELLKNQKAKNFSIRGTCYDMGYQSLALIALKYEDTIVGILQLNNKSKNFFTLEMINFYEGIGESIGIALAKNKAKEELLKTQVQLFQTSKLSILGEMSAGLAHEMNQPLGGIALITQNLRKLKELNSLEDKELEYGFNDIDYSVKRMTKIIQHIRTFARQDTLKFISVDVEQTIESALNLLSEQLRLHEIEVQKEYSKNLPKIIGEPFQLEQVWINLITNARDAVDEKANIYNKKEVLKDFYKKRIIFKTIYDEENKIIIVSIIDNGIGIKKEIKNKIFEPFFTTKEIGKATGLGLSISYGIIESHKAKLEFNSVENEGTSANVIFKNNQGYS